MRPISPGPLEAEQDSPIRRKLETLLSDGRSRDIPAQALEPTTIAAIDGRTRVDVDCARPSAVLVDLRGLRPASWPPSAPVDPTHISDGLTRRRHFPHRMHELASPLAGGGAQQLAVTYRGGVARREDRLVSCELVGGIVELVERPTVTRTHPSESVVGATGNLGHLLGRGAR